MKRSNTTIVLLTIISVIVAYFTISSELLSLEKTEDDFFLGAISQLGAWFFKFIILGILIFSAMSVFKHKKKGFIIPLIVTSLNLFAVFYILYTFNKRESSPVVFQAHYDGDINGLTLYLRQNRTYKISDFAFFGETNYYGNYEIKGDYIILSKKYPLGIDRSFMEDKLLKYQEFVLIKRNSRGQYDPKEYMKLRIVKDELDDNR